MTDHFNKSAHREERRLLRNNPTIAEAKLWKRLSRSKMMGYKFRRQYGIDAFKLDFFCSELGLAIEVDGEIHNHPDNQDADRERQKHIEHFGITFLRLTNDEIENNIDNALNKIAGTILTLKGGTIDTVFTDSDIRKPRAEPV